MTTLQEPRASDEAQPFWDATREQRFVLPWCTECDRAIWYPRATCPACFGSAIEWRDDHGEGTVYAVSVHHRPGPGRAAELRELTVEILRRGNAIAAERGILLADTKVEFGVDAGGALVLADEVLTPDSSRFWPADEWVPGRAQASFDKQFVRDWLTSPASGWSKSSGDAPPPLPAEVVEQTRARYVEAYERLTGERFVPLASAR